MVSDARGAARDYSPHVTGLPPAAIQPDQKAAVIMVTSPLRDKATRAFFEHSSHYGPDHWARGGVATPSRDDVDERAR